MKFVTSSLSLLVVNVIVILTFLSLSVVESADPSNLITNIPANAKNDDTPAVNTCVLKDGQGQQQQRETTTTCETMNIATDNDEESMKSQQQQNNK